MRQGEFVDSKDKGPAKTKTILGVVKSSRQSKRHTVGKLFGLLMHGMNSAESTILFKL